MKGIIVYKGRYGATQQYAQWLGEELNFPFMAAEDATKETLKDYDLVVIGTSVYIGKLQISHWLKENRAALIHKKLYLFQVAGTPPEQKEKLDPYIRNGVPEEIRNQCEIHFLPGRLNIQKLSWMDRFMLKMGAKMVKDPAAKKGMLTDYNHVAKEHLAPLINSVKRKFATAV